MLKQLTLVPEQLHNSPDRSLAGSELNLDLLSGAKPPVGAVPDRFEEIPDLGVKGDGGVIHAEYHHLFLRAHFPAVLPDNPGLGLKAVQTGLRKGDLLRPAGESIAGNDLLPGSIRQ